MSPRHLSPGIVNTHANISDWRSRMTERVRFDSESVLNYTAVHEIMLPRARQITRRKRHGRVPIPIQSFARYPAKHVRCFIDGTELPVAPRSSERRLCARWIARSLTSPNFENQNADLVRGLRMIDAFEEWEDSSSRKHDYQAAALWALDVPVQDGEVKLDCGVTRSELWQAIRRFIPSSEYMLEKLQNDRMIVVLPDRELLSASPQCFVSRYHGVTPTYHAWIGGVLHFLYRGVKRRRKKIGIIEYDAWNAPGPLNAAVNPQTKWRRFRADLRSVYKMTLSWRRRSISKLNAAGDQCPADQHMLTIADGSAMKVARVSGRLANDTYASRMRWPWFIPDTTVVDIPLGTSARERSYHFELEAPDGVYVHSAVLRIRNRLREFIFVEDDDVHHDRCHLHFTKSLSRRTTNPADYFPGTARVVMRPTWHNGLRVALTAQLVNLVVLAALFLIYGVSARSGTAPDFVVSRAGADTEAIVALIALAPTVAMSWIARQNEHMLTKLVQNGLRRRLTLSAILSLASAFSLAAKLEGENLYWVLLLSVGFCGWWALLTAWSSANSWFRLRQHRSHGAKSRV